MTDRPAASQGQRVRPADNPFASHRVDALPFRAAGTSLEELAAKLDAVGGRAAIVGPEGSGKTTLLEGLARTLEDEVVLVVPAGPRRNGWRSIEERLPPRIGPHHTVLVDAAGRLGPTGWLRLKRRSRHAGRLVFTSHRAGRLPTLHCCRTTPDLLADLVRELAPHHVRNLQPGLVDLFARHHGNLRLCFRELYDRFGEMTQDPGVQFSVPNFRF
jgi:energy-coupling factor transporter ATP-binding protein EcfA2